jgi:hypothetical protein
MQTDLGLRERHERVFVGQEECAHVDDGYAESSADFFLVDRNPTIGVAFFAVGPIGATNPIKRFWPLLDEVPHKLGNLIRSRIECEVPAVDNVHLSVWHIAAVRLGLGGIERCLVLTPNHQ